MSVGSGNPATLPLASLLLPIIVMAAAMGTRQVLAVGAMMLAVALTLYYVPAFANPAIQNGLVQRGIALAATAVVLAVGTRRTVATLERAVAQARAASAGLRRRTRQMAAIEAIGRRLASSGPTPDALDHVMGLLVERFGYRYPSIYSAMATSCDSAPSAATTRSSRRSTERSGWSVASCARASPNS